VHLCPIPVKLDLVDVGTTMETEHKLDHFARIPTRQAAERRSEKPPNGMPKESAKDGTTTVARRVGGEARPN
jgi:hypothetical protein